MMDGALIVTFNETGKITTTRRRGQLRTYERSTISWAYGATLGWTTSVELMDGSWVRHCNDGTSQDLLGPHVRWNEFQEQTPGRGIGYDL